MNKSSASLRARLHISREHATGSGFPIWPQLKNNALRGSRPFTYVDAADIT